MSEIENKITMKTKENEEETIAIHVNANINKEPQQTTTPPLLPMWKIIALTFGMIGNQLIWALQNGNASAYFLSLGMPDYLVGFAWLPGPLGGIIVQPLIGNISDRSTLKWGRRRPFLILTVFLVVLFSLIFSNSQLISIYFGEESNYASTISLIVAVLSLWAIDWSINGTQTILRALFVDISPSSQHTVGMAWFSWMNSFGNIIGYGLGMFNYSSLGFISNVQALYLIGSIILIITIAVTVISSKEIPLEKIQIILGNDERTILEKIGISQLKNIFFILTKFPKEIRLVWFTQNIAFFAWFFLMLYATVWVGVNIYEGDPNAPPNSVALQNYNKGVQVGNGALMLQAIGSMIYSILLPTILKHIDPRLPYGLAQLIQAIFMMLAYWIMEPWQAVFVLVILAIPWSTAWTIPWSLASTALTHSEDKGLYLAGFFLSQVFPEIFTVVFANIILYFNDNVGLVISIGGAVALLTLGMIPFFPIAKIRALGEPKVMDEM